MLPKSTSANPYTIITDYGLRWSSYYNDIVDPEYEFISDDYFMEKLIESWPLLTEPYPPLNSDTLGYHPTAYTYINI